MRGLAHVRSHQFTADCNAAVRADRSHKLVREVVARAVSDPTAVVAGLGEPCRAEVQRLYNSAELTILNVIWGPLMTAPCLPIYRKDVSGYPSGGGKNWRMIDCRMWTNIQSGNGERAAQIGWP
jgi:hypothetical protein